MTTQAGTMPHPSVERRSAPSTTPDLAAGCHGLLGSLASGAALGLSTTWAPPSDRHSSSLTNACTTASIFQSRYTTVSKNQGKITMQARYVIATLAWHHVDDDRHPHLIARHALT